MRLLKFLVPLAIFIGITWFLLRGLERDPREIPSPLLGKPAPTFSLPTLADPQAGWTPESMRGKVWMLNVWGSWCSACQVEHPLLLDIAKAGTVPIVGFAWKDNPTNSRAWLAKLGDPYAVVVMDFPGKVGIDYGVYGAPETFVIDKSGTVRYKQVGPISPEAWQRKLLPMIQQLQAQG